VHGQVAAIATALSALERTGLTTPLHITKVNTPASPGHFTQRIGQRFVVVAGDRSARSHPTPDLLLHLQPSRAFGSGLHPATRLSLQLLERHVNPTMQALDLGSGSGILSVAMAKLGAQVWAVDNDPIAVQATQTAVDHNQVATQVTVRAGSLGQGSQLGHWLGGAGRVAVAAVTEHFDIVVANILARIHITLAPDYGTALQKPDGARLLIIAGFTQEYQADVTAALAAVGFVVIDSAHCDEWVALVYRLSGSGGAVLR
jgi:ribosomal protein L11 methyltransferase